MADNDKTMRKCTLEDVDWLIEITREKYGELFTNHEVARKWLAASIIRDNLMVMAIESSYVITAIHTSIFNDKKTAHAIFYGGKARQVIRLIRESMVWSKGQGAETYHFGSGNRKVDKLASILKAKHSEDYVVRL